MAANTNVFNFDVNPFLRGVQKIGEGMDRIQSNAKKFGETMTNSMGKAVNGLIVKVGLLFAAFKGLGAVLKEMPEVGQAFGIAKDVFLKNLLWPLRQQVMPMLQRMLDWVRDNRAQFVKWGVVVANVFRSVVSVARTLWDVMKSLVDTVGGAFQRAFHTNFKSFDEFVNVLSFKVSAVIVYLGMLAKDLVKDFTPAFDWIMRVGGEAVGFFLDLVDAWTSANSQGKSISTIMESLKEAFRVIGSFIENAAKGFREGFTPAMKDAMTPINDMVDALTRIMKALGMDDATGVRGAFKALGGIVGGGLKLSLDAIATSFMIIATSLETIRGTWEALDKLMKGDKNGSAKALNKTNEGILGTMQKAAESFGMGDLFKKVFEASNVGNWGFQKTERKPSDSMNDGIVTKTGRVIKTSPDDNIFAAKDFSAYGRGGGATMGPMNVGPFYVTVTEGDAEQAGRSFGEGLAYSFRNRVSSARLAEGF